MTIRVQLLQAGRDLEAAAPQRGVPARLRNWSGKLGSQITSLRGTLSPTGDNVSAVASNLRGLFQRQGSGNNGHLTGPLMAPSLALTLPPAHSQAAASAAGSTVGAEPTAASSNSAMNDGSKLLTSDQQPSAGAPEDAPSRTQPSADSATDLSTASPREQETDGLWNSAVDEEALSKHPAQEAGAVSQSTAWMNGSAKGLPFDDSGFREATISPQAGSRPNSAQKTSPRKSQVTLIPCVAASLRNDMFR